MPGVWRHGQKTPETGRAWLEPESNEAEEAARTLIATVAHDLTNPLAAILGFVGILQENRPGLGAEQREQILGCIRATAERMGRLLAGVLDVERVTHGGLRLDRHPTDLAEIVRRVIAETDIAGRRPVHFDASPAVAWVDAVLVERVVENLLANAERHTPAGTPVWVRVRPSDDGALVEVEDAGDGVSVERGSAILRPFQPSGRAGPCRGTPSSGNGLGLALVARFAELNGGRVGVRERPGGGASFWTWLPADAPEGSTRKLPPLPNNSVR